MTATQLTKCILNEAKQDVRNCMEATHKAICVTNMADFPSNDAKRFLNAALNFKKEAYTLFMVLDEKEGKELLDSAKNIYRYSLSCIDFAEKSIEANEVMFDYLKDIKEAEQEQNARRELDVRVLQELEQDGDW